MYSNSSSYNSSYMDSIDPKFLQLLSKLVRKVLRGDGTYDHIYQTYNQLIYQPWSTICKGRRFGTRLVNLGGVNTPWVLEQISSKHCTTFTNGGNDTWIYYHTLIKLYLNHHMCFLGRIGIQENSMNLLVVLRFQPPMVDDSK